MAPIKATDNVYLTTFANGQKFELGNQYQLNEAKKIVAIEAYGANQLGKTPQGKNVINDAAFKSSYITLVTSNNNSETVKEYPLASLCPLLNNGIIRELDLEKINIPRCSILFGNSAAVVDNEQIVLVFHFIK